MMLLFFLIKFLCILCINFAESFNELIVRFNKFLLYLSMRNYVNC